LRQYLIASRVIVPPVRVPVAIHLHHQRARVAVEVQYEARGYLLAAKMQAVEAIRLELLP
jgi:hypothetical protein